MRIQRIDLTLMVSAILIAGATAALAQSSDTQGTTPSAQPSTPPAQPATPPATQPATPPTTQPATQPDAQPSAPQTQAAPTQGATDAAQPDAKAKMVEILARGAQLPAKSRSDAEAKLQEAMNDVN